MSAAPDLAQIRLDNALALFDEFVHNTIKHPDAATLRGLEGRFAERLGIQPSYWSQLKGRSRQIGERLARQFELACHKPYGWMDHVQGATAHAVAAPFPQENYAPRDDDERFIVGLVLSYYRRHPQKARTRLLDLLGEVLTPSAAPAPVAAPAPAPPTAPARMSGAAAGNPGKPTPAPTATDDALWRRMQAGVAPLRQKK